MFIEIKLEYSETRMYVRVDSITHIIEENGRAKIYIQGREHPYKSSAKYNEIISQINDTLRGNNEPD